MVRIRRHRANRSNRRITFALVVLPFGVYMYSRRFLRSDNYTAGGLVGSANRYDAAASGSTIVGTKRRIHTVFSTDCRPYQDWQSHALATNHRKMNIEGRLVRLMACDDPNYDLPKSSYSKYRVVRTPDFARLNTTDSYWPINRPMGLSYWLSGMSDDTDVPLGDEG